MINTKTISTWPRNTCVTLWGATQDTSPDSSSTRQQEQQQHDNEIQDRVKQIKQTLLALSQRTDRGFRASREENVKARNLIFQLAKYNPTPQPASCYYDDDTTLLNNNNYYNNNNKHPSIKGKWTLIYTDAPDITSLQNSNNIFAQLGRIGQECDEENYISNVIEWKPPTWIKSFGSTTTIGGANERILQRVKTKASASPSRPTIVNLKVAGLELQAPPLSTSSTTSSTTTRQSNQASSDTNNNNIDNNTSKQFSFDIIQKRVQERGWVAGLLEQYPVKFPQEPFQNVPFGEFEILYLDHEMRAIKTGQNFLAVNLRITNPADEWF